MLLTINPVHSYGIIKGKVPIRSILNLDSMKIFVFSARTFHFASEYLGNPWADFGSVKSIGKVFSRAWRKVQSDFWSDLKQTSYSRFSHNLARSDEFPHKLCKLGPWIWYYGIFSFGFVMWASIPFHRALIHVSTAIFSEVGNFDLMLRRPFWKWPKKWVAGSKIACVPADIKIRVL